MSKNIVAETIGFTTFQKVVLLKPMGLQHFQTYCCEQNLFYYIPKNKVVFTIGFTAFPTTMVLEPLVLQHFQT